MIRAANPPTTGVYYWQQPFMSEHHLTSTRFSEFNLQPELLKSLTEAGFEFCTPIQEQSIPIALTGKDVAGEAQTGTGKTAAFMVACVQHLLTHPAPESRRKQQPRAMVLAPTRELAIQIHKDSVAIAKHTSLKFGLAYGGTGYDQQRAQLAEGGRYSGRHTGSYHRLLQTTCF